jgi:hypothetical protein
LKKKYSLTEISKLRKLTEAVVSMQIETIIEYMPNVDLSAIISDEKVNMIKQQFQKGNDSLKGLRNSLPLEFTYPLIRIALAKLKAQRS